MHLKYAPKLRFVADESFAEAERVQRLIDQGLAELGRGARSDEGGEHG
jgi:ribosome-binding factor A